MKARIRSASMPPKPLRTGAASARNTAPMCMGVLGPSAERNAASCGESSS